MKLQLYSYEHSVYSWIARLALAEKNLAYELIEVDPFQESPPLEFLKINPLCRVPALSDGKFSLYETASITRYIDEAFPGAVLQPRSAEARALQNQVIAILDNDGYWPLVRQVFVHSFYNPLFSETVDVRELDEGLIKSEHVLSALEGLIRGEQYIAGNEFSLADIHAFPMLAYFAASNEGSALLVKFKKLSVWYRAQLKRATIHKTCPDLPFLQIDGS